MGRSSCPVKIQRWMERIQRFSDSGQTVARFCADERVSVPSFYNWKKKLRHQPGVVRQSDSSRQPGAFRNAFQTIELMPARAATVTIRLPNGIVIELDGEADLIPAHHRRKPKKKRDDSLPANLPRYEVVADVTDQQKQCETHGEKSLLPEAMWDKTESLEFTPPSLKVRVTKYPKYACPADPLCGITSAERPATIVQGNKYDASIAAEIISAKFGYHLPIYRQQDWFAGSGWTPGRSTLLNILSGCAVVLAPLLDFFKRTVQQDSVIGCDDTSVTLLYPKNVPKLNLDDPKERRIAEVFSKALEDNKPSINAKMWAYRGANVKLNVFDFTVSRHRDGPELPSVPT